jgi:RecA/RadA recombinase
MHLAAGLLRPPSQHALSATGALLRFAIVHIEPAPQPAMALALRPLRLDARVIDHLHGVARFDDLVAEVVRPLESGPLAAEHAALAEQLDGSSGSSEFLGVPRVRGGKPVAEEPEELRGTPRNRVINLIGSPQTGKETLAVAIAARAKRTVHKIDPRRLPPLGPERTATMKALEREARLLRLAYYIQPPEREDVNSEVAMQDLVETLDAPLFVDTRDAWPGARRVTVIRVERPDRNAQRLLWAEAVGADEGLAAFIDDLVEQFDFSPEMIARAARAAGGVTSARVLWDVCQQQVSWRIDDLAQRITTRQAWDDLVLDTESTAQLREIASQVSQRARVYERWGFAARLTRGRGITALFAGPSGTGKTMAAEILAGELGLELYRIDLAGVVSKYIGESEKNLRRVFDAAEQSGAILFFDEADALFGKRTDVKDSHDLYANIQVNYLLQRMEDYRGLAILATNRKTALDRAFLRRLRFVIDFPFPDAEARLRIWRNAFPEQAPVSALDYEFLSRLEIAGGNIRNIALGAAFLAAADGSGIEERHVMHAVRREYAKIQKLVTETEFGPHYRGRP